MSSGDRGGNAQLIQFIHGTSFPMICICNDARAPKMRTLESNCVSLKFSKPQKSQIANRLQMICRAEGMTSEHNALEKLAELTNNDFRQAITTLEVISKSTKVITMNVITSSKTGKDVNVMMNFFEASRQFLSGRDIQQLSFKEKMDLFFVDYDMIPMMIYENALSAIGTNATLKDANRLAEASELMAFGDVINTSIRKNNNWSLLKD